MLSFLYVYSDHSILECYNLFSGVELSMRSFFVIIALLLIELVMDINDWVSIYLPLISISFLNPAGSIHLPIFSSFKTSQHHLVPEV